MRDRLNQLLNYMADTGTKSQVAEELVVRYLKTYDELEELGLKRDSLNKQIENILRDIEISKRDLDHAETEYFNNKDDTGDKYLLQYINAMDYERRKLDLKEMEHEDLLNELSKTEKRIEEMVAILPKSPEEAEKIIEEILSEIDRTLALNREKFSTLRKKLSKVKSGDGNTQGAPSGLGE